LLGKQAGILATSAYLSTHIHHVNDLRLLVLPGARHYICDLRLIDWSHPEYLETGIDKHSRSDAGTIHNRNCNRRELWWWWHQENGKHSRQAMYHN
jgi:hypothetical protein